MDTEKEQLEKTLYYQEINNLVYRIRMGFLYDLVNPEDTEQKFASKVEDINTLIGMIESPSAKELLRLYSIGKLRNTVGIDAIHPNVLLDEIFCKKTLEICYIEILRNSPDTPIEGKNRLQISEFSYLLWKSEKNSLTNYTNDAFGYVNGVKVMGAIFELVEYAKIIARYLDIEVFFNSNTFLENLVFNYRYIFRGWNVSIFASSFLKKEFAETQHFGEEGKYKYEDSLASKRGYFAWFFYNNPTDEQKKNQEFYFT